MARQKTQSQINLPSIQPVASPPPRAAQVQPPAPVAEFSNLDDLAPLSATLAKIAGHRKKLKDAEELPGQQADGSLAFDKVEPELSAAYEESFEATRELLEQGVSYLTAPEAIDSFWRDAGINAAARARSKANEGWESIVPAVDANGLPTEQQLPREYFMEQAAEMDEFVAGLHPEARVSYDKYKTGYADEFDNRVGSAQLKAKEEYDFQLKTDRYKGWLYDFADKGEFDDPDFSGFAAMTDLDWARHFTRNREAARVAIEAATARAGMGDQDHKALAFLDSVVEGMELNGVPISKDPSMMTLIEELEIKYTESQDSKASVAQRELNANIKLFQGDLRQSWGARFREAQGNPVEVNALVEEMRAEVESDPAMSQHSEDIMEGMQEYGRDFYEDEITADPKVVEALQEAIRTFDPSAIALIRAADIPTAMKDQLEQKARERGDQKQYHQGHPAYVGLVSATKTQLNADLYSSDRSRVIQDFQRGIDKRRDALYSQAISEGLAAGVTDMHSFLEGKAAEIEEKFLPEIRAFEDEQERMRNTVEDKITDRLKRNVDASELIGQAYIEGHLDEAQRKALLDQNDLAIDLDDKFFTNSQIFQDKLRELMSKVEAADGTRLAELLGASDLLATGTSPALELLKGRMEREFTRRGYEWLEENLESTEPNAQKRSWREALDLMVEEYETRIFSDAAKDQTTEAGSILEGDTEDAEVRLGFSDRFKEHEREVAQPPEVFAQSYESMPGEDASLIRAPSAFLAPVDGQRLRDEFPWSGIGSAPGQWKHFTRSHATTYRRLLEGKETRSAVMDAAYETAVRIMDNPDITEEQRTEALKDIAITSQLTPLAVVTGKVSMRPPWLIANDRNRAALLGVRQKRRWYELGYDDPAAKYRELVKGTNIQAEMDDFYSRTVEVTIKPEDVDPLRDLIWHSEAALEHDRKHRPELVDAIMEMYEVEEEQRYLVFQAQFNLIDKHYNHTDQ